LKKARCPADSTKTFGVPLFRTLSSISAFRNGLRFLLLQKARLSHTIVSASFGGIGMSCPL
jgi:hypothetical protein